MKKYSSESQYNSILMVHLFFLMVCLIYLLMVTVDLLNVNSSFDYTYILATSMFIWMIYSWQCFSKLALNFYTVFLVLCYIFYFGQYFLAFFDILYTNRVATIYEFYNIRIYNFWAGFVLLAIMTMHFGAILRNYYKISWAPSFKCSSDKAIKIAIIIIGAISIMPHIYTIYISYISLLEFGYSNEASEIMSIRNATGIDSLLFKVGQLFIPVIFLLNVLYRKNHKKLLWVVTIIYSLGYAFTGHRMAAILLIMAITLIYEINVSWKNFIKYMLICFLGIFIMSFISHYRNNISLDNNIMHVLQNAFNSMLENNIVNSVLAETGFTFISMVRVFEYCPQLVDYNYGLTYVYNVFALFPNLFWDRHPASRQSIDLIFNNTPMFGYTGYSLGSSFIAELYYNFGFFMMPFIAVIGYVFAHLCKLMDRALKYNNKLDIFFYSYLFSLLIIWVRSDTVQTLRSLFYYCLGIIIFIKLIDCFLRKDKSDGI